MVVIDLCLTKSNSEGPQLRVVSARAESLPGHLRTSNLSEASIRVFCITQETDTIRTLQKNSGDLPLHHDTALWN